MISNMENNTPTKLNLRDCDFTPIGFNHGVYEVDYTGDTKPTKDDLVQAATKAVDSDKLYFDISQTSLDHAWENWRRWGHCQFSLVVLRYDGRSYLHG